MGDQVGSALSGMLYYVPQREFERVLSLRATKVERAALFATLCRLNTLYMIARAGSGHIGSSFSSMDIVSWLLLSEMRVPEEGHDGPRDVYFSSKGHDVPGFYAALIGLGRLDFELLHRLRRLGGLPGHPDVSTPYIETNTGSLGMGISKAKGMIYANRLLGREGRIYVLTGDGELQEGQFWESLIGAANNCMSELIAIIDHNKLQSDTLVEKVSSLGDLEAKLRSFGWYVERCNGHDPDQLAACLDRMRGVENRPQAIIADTIKGCGVSFMEANAESSGEELYKFHSGAPSPEVYAQAVNELTARANEDLARLGTSALTLETQEVEPSRTLRKPQRLVGAYSETLVELAGKIPHLVALDADLMLDTGLIPFRREYPERFVESGIAEQDMVSQAGGMARKGLLPVVHSFACFLSARPNEQIYNNATEHTKVIYVGSLAGVLPGGPGHSHQSVRDIAALSAIPNLTLIEPSTERETRMVLDYCVTKSKHSCYLRLVSIPCEVPFELPRDYVLQEGRGVRVREGEDAIVFAYGPVMLSEAYQASVMLAVEGVSVRIVNLPWLNRIDRDWLSKEVKSVKWLFTLDNHYVSGGQGNMVHSALTELGLAGVMGARSFGIQTVPACGTNEEVLKAHGLDAEGIARKIREAMGGPSALSMY